MSFYFIVAMYILIVPVVLFLIWKTGQLEKREYAMQDREDAVEKRERIVEHLASLPSTGVHYDD